MATGFIRDKLEIRFLILYIAARLQGGVDAAEMQELTMIDGGINYFDFSICLNDLVETEHLQLSEGKYTITAKGVRNSEICESALPLSVRQRADKELARFNRVLKRRENVRCTVTPRENGTYTVTLYLQDEVDELLDLRVMVAGEDMAKDLQARFEKDPENLYTRLLATLYG